MGGCLAMLAQLTLELSAVVATVSRDVGAFGGGGGGSRSVGLVRA